MKYKIFKNFFNSLIDNKLLLSAFSGVLLSLTLIFLNLYFIAWIALVPLLYSVFTNTKKAANFKVLMVFSLFFYLPVYSWFLYLHPLDWKGVENTLSLLTAIGIWLGASVIHSLLLSLIGVFYKWAKPEKILMPLTFAVLWTFMEFSQEYSAFAFPWAKLALSQTSQIALIQSASLFGSLFISFLIVFVNGFIAYGIILIKEKNLNFRPVFLTVLLIFTLNLSFGYFSIYSKQNFDSQPKIKAAAIQGNINPVEKWADNTVDDFSIFMDLSIKAADDGAKIIVWPETSITSVITPQHQHTMALEKLAKDRNLYIMVGAFIQNEQQRYNSLVLFTPEGNQIDKAYHKRQLVPFGEHIPYMELLGFVFEKFPNLNVGAPLTPGSGTVIHQTEYGSMSGGVCFDSVFPCFFYEAAKEGSQLFYMSTNDSFYRNSANPYQHNAHSALRAVENNRYVIRAANTGVSSIVANTGEMLSILELNQTGYVINDIRFISNTTFYAQTGNLIIRVFAGFYVSIFIFRYLTQKQAFKKRKNKALD